MTTAGVHVHVPVTVDATTIRLGDQLLVGGQSLTVTDLVALPQGAKRVRFASGETLTLQRTSVFYATRRHVPGAD
ncbi:hypothetical protein RM780_15580 [Streptomyces sp. DSM 44917]|uniref:Uncharacterized protein n=1 Tax=Streptomyces boetiae TaxID=3075541 RepID=A0ABU2L9X4_9ACTN|nr:hypothetical protein [Streptomyces sp. DSM 44917]MDT0308371.1 hypothetical protein [Streptomyces sp. DSM 44917]